MTAHSTAVHSAEAASHPRSRLRARLVLAALSACGLAALAWASFGLPKPRLIYNPSDSVPVGWYRVDPSSNRTDSLPRPLSVGSIVLVPLPAEAATLAAQRGYLPTRVPLLKRVGAIAPQEVCIAGSSVRIDGVPSAAVLRADRLGRPLPSWRQCRASSRRTVPAQQDQSGVVRQPLFRPGQRIRRDRRGAPGLAGFTPMMAADSLHADVHCIVPSGVSIRWLLPCRRACSANAFALHFALPTAQPSTVQASCLERARPAALAAFAGGLAASSAAPPGRHCRERKQEAKAEGKIKGRGTGPRRKPVCTWGWRSTARLRRRAACGAKPAPRQGGPRASHDGTRRSFPRGRP